MLRYSNTPFLTANSKKRQKINPKLLQPKLTARGALGKYGKSPKACGKTNLSSSVCITQPAQPRCRLYPGQIISAIIRQNIIEVNIRSYLQM